MSPNSSTPGNNPTPQIPSQAPAEGVSEDTLPTGARPQIPLLSTHCHTFDSPNIGGVHLTNLKTGNFHWVQLKKQYGFIYYRRWQETKGIKDFIAVLMFYRDYAADEIEAAVELAIENNISAGDGVRHLLVYAGGADTTIAPLASWPSLPPPDIAVYGQLGGVQ